MGTKADAIRRLVLRADITNSFVDICYYSAVGNTLQPIFESYELRTSQQVKQELAFCEVIAFDHYAVGLHWIYNLPR